MSKQQFNNDAVSLTAMALLWGCESLEQVPGHALLRCGEALYAEGVFSGGDERRYRSLAQGVPSWMSRPLAARRPPSVSASGRAGRGCLVPEILYRQVIVRSLYLHGGRVFKQFVDQVVVCLLGSYFTWVDLGEVPSGGVRWEIRVRAAREALVLERLVVYGTPYGEWKLTRDGQAEALRLILES